MSDLYSYNDWRDYEALKHHGILGQKWYVKNGPPYPLDAEDHNASEKKAGWRDSLDGVREGINDRIQAKQNRKDVINAIRSINMDQFRVGHKPDGSDVKAAKAVKRFMTKDQLKRLYTAGERVDAAYDREEGTKNQKLEKERSDWAEKEARKLVEREMQNKYSGLSDMSPHQIEKVVEYYKIEMYEPRWDGMHREYSERNAGQESWDEAWDNYKNEINDISKELIGSHASKDDMERMDHTLRKIDSLKRYK